MKSTKRLLCLLLCAVMVLGLLTACGGQGEETTPSSSATEATTVPTTVPETEPIVTETYYYFYSAYNRGWFPSEIKDYPSVTGSKCIAIAKDFYFLIDENYQYMVDGDTLGVPDFDAAVFLYEYDASQLDTYVAYLEQCGFEKVGTYCDGRINYYTMFVAPVTCVIKTVVDADGAYVAISPYVYESVLTTGPYFIDGEFTLTHGDFARLLEAQLSESGMAMTLSTVETNDAGQALYHFFDAQTGTETEYYIGMECDPDTGSILNNIMVYSVLGENPDTVLQLAAACSAIVDPAMDEETVLSIPSMEAEYDDAFNTIVHYTSGDLTFSWLSEPYYMIAFNIALAKTE